MSDFVLEQAKKLRDEGCDHGKIRTYLSNSGYSDTQITQTLAKIDSDEIHNLYLKQKYGNSRNQFFASLLFLFAGIGYSLYKFNHSGELEPFALLIPSALALVAYFKLAQTKKGRYTSSRIIKENKKYR